MSDSGELSGDRHPRTQDKQGPLGDVIPDADGRDTRTGGGQSPEPVENRPNVSQIKPEDYPDKAKADLALPRKEP